jgi:hypothetical protein
VITNPLSTKKKSTKSQPERITAKSENKKKPGTWYKTTMIAQIPRQLSSTSNLFTVVVAVTARIIETGFP